MNDYLPELYTDRDLTRARRRGKVVGWLQGGTAVLLFGIGYSLIGTWLPTLLVLGVVGFVVYKLVRASKGGDESV
ncbi:MAG: hypothetical protein P8Y26_00785 [Gemmatimonadales bacterium]